MSEEPRPLSAEDVLWLVIGYIEALRDGIEALDKYDMALSLDELLKRLNNLKTESEQSEGQK